MREHDRDGLALADRVDRPFPPAVGSYWRRNNTDDDAAHGGAGASLVRRASLAPIGAARDASRGSSARV
jgi:hypothetical protein